MVEVAVIGSGAAGLVTARHLLRCGLRACLFDSRDRYGGAWSVDRTSRIDAPARAQMWKNLVPNLSKYTCSFSDMPWKDDTALFPSLAEMDDYLQGYAQKFVVEDPSCTTMFGCTVTHVSQCPEQKYMVDWKELGGIESSRLFDGVVVATGFLAEPHWPADVVFDDSLSKDSSDILLHSSQYSDPDSFADMAVAVVGGSFSAHEIASDVRQHAARVVNIGGNTYHYVLPRFIPNKDTASFGPIDCILYQRSCDAPASEKTTVDPESSQKRHTLLRQLIGSTKLAQLSAKGFPPLPSLESSPMISISDNFADLVIDGKIQVMAKRLTNVNAVSEQLALTLDDGTTLRDIDRIILCTGYRCNLDFLSTEMLQALEYDDSSQTPLVLFHEALHPDLPGLGFVGMYKGSYFGVMELQARLIAAQMSGQLDLDETTVRHGIEEARATRTANPQAQFPHFDYVGMMDGIAELVGLTPDPTTFGRKGSYVVPAFYQPNVDQATVVANELENKMHSAMNLGQATLSALVGEWSFDRVIEDKLSNVRQIVQGTVRFSFQNHCFDSLRYREDGHLLLPNGNKLDVFREYDYISRGNGLEIFFVEGGERTYMFLSLMFEKSQADGNWVATSDHLCIKDLYKVRTTPGVILHCVNGTLLSRMSTGDVQHSLRWDRRARGPNEV